MGEHVALSFEQRIAQLEDALQQVEQERDDYKNAETSERVLRWKKRAEVSEAKLSDREKELAILRNVHYRPDDGRGCIEAYEALRTRIEEVAQRLEKADSDSEWGDDFEAEVRAAIADLRKAANKEGE